MIEKVTIDHFRRTIFEAYSHYYAWKMIAYSKSTKTVSEEMAERYVTIQNYHGMFFTFSERAFLISFIMLVLHPFDKNVNSFSLHQIDKKKTKQFATKYKEILDELSLVRNKILAHSDIDPESGTLKLYPVPSPERLDVFFNNLIEFYNQLCKGVDGSITYFDSAEGMKRDIERLFMNIYRGEKVRNNELDIKLFWEEHDKKISDVI